MHTFTVWAPAASSVDLVLRDGVLPLRPAADGWWKRKVVEAHHGTEYAFSLDGAAAARPAMRGSRTGRTASAVSTTTASRGRDDDWRGLAAARRGPLRAARRHVHARGHLRRGRRAPRPPRRARRHIRRADAGCPFPGATAGATTASTCTRCTSRTAGRTALKRFVDACHAPGSAVVPRRGPQPPRPDGNYLPSSGRTSPTATDAWGGRQPRRRRLATRCALLLDSALRGCATTTSTGCGWTRSMRCTTTPPRCTSWQELSPRWTRSPAGSAGRCS